MAKKKPKRKAKAARKARPAAVVRLSVKAYSEHRGCSRAAVRKAIEAARISESVTQNARGWFLIEPVLADEEWARESEPRKEVLPEGGETSAEGGDGRQQKGSLTAAKTLNTEYQAELNYLKLLELKANLGRMDEAEEARYRTGRDLRDAIMAVPPMMAEELAAETDPVKHEILLEAALLQALESFAGSAKSDAAGEVA